MYMVREILSKSSSAVSSKYHFGRMGVVKQPRDVGGLGIKMLNSLSLPYWLLDIIVIVIYLLTLM